MMICHWIEEYMSSQPICWDQSSEPLLVAHLSAQRKLAALKTSRTTPRCLRYNTAAPMNGQQYL